MKHPTKRFTYICDACQKELRMDDVDRIRTPRGWTWPVISELRFAIQHVCSLACKQKLVAENKKEA